MALAEGLQERGRSGSVRAKRVLEQLFGAAINLSFNAYDHTRLLTFADSVALGGTSHSFSFDLGGQLRRRNADRFDGEEIVELFVEIKTRSSAGALLADYREFLRRAAIVLGEDRRDARLIFFTNVPFGARRGAELVDGSLLRECAQGWHVDLSAYAHLVQERIALIIATDSFVSLMTQWVRDDE